MQSGIEELTKAAETLGAYKMGLLDSFKHFSTNSGVEGDDNKIKTLKRQAYGFRRMPRSKLRLFPLPTPR